MNWSTPVWSMDIPRGTCKSDLNIQEELKIRFWSIVASENQLHPLGLIMPLLCNLPLH
jgi:hypothetical protein